MTVRLWSRNQVKVGGRYPVGGGLIEIDSIEELPFAAIDDLDVRRAGEADRESLRQRASSQRTNLRRHHRAASRVPRGRPHLTAFGMPPRHRSIRTSQAPDRSQLQTWETARRRA